MKNVDQIIELLCLSSLEANKFRSSIKSNKTRLKDIAKLSSSEECLLSEEHHFRIISEWEYYAVVTLLETQECFSEANSIAIRLGLSKVRAEYVVSILLLEKLITQNGDGNYKKNVKRLTTTKDVPSRALRSAHIELLELAATKIEKVPVDDRFYSASTLAIKKDSLGEIKEIIREFRNKLGQHIAKDDTDEVYQMNIQLFPLTIQN